MKEITHGTVGSCEMVSTLAVVVRPSVLTNSFIQTLCGFTGRNICSRTSDHQKEINLNMAFLKELLQLQSFFWNWPIKNILGCQRF